MAASIVPENSLNESEHARRLRQSTSISETNKTSLHELKTRQLEAGKRHTVRKRPRYVEGEPKDAWHSRLESETGCIVTHLIIAEPREW